MPSNLHSPVSSSSHEQSRSLAFALGREKRIGSIRSVTEMGIPSDPTMLMFSTDTSSRVTPSLLVCGACAKLAPALSSKTETTATTSLSPKAANIDSGKLTLAPVAARSTVIDPFDELDRFAGISSSCAKLTMPSAVTIDTVSLLARRASTRDASTFEMSSIVTGGAVGAGVGADSTDNSVVPATTGADGVVDISPTVEAVTVVEDMAISVAAVAVSVLVALEELVAVPVVAVVEELAAVSVMAAL